ncbi:MAG: copper resistance CopC/CopD family protein [Actinomycetota bacterium]
MLATVLVTPGTASAHANLVESVPANGSTLPEVPEEIVLRFSDAVDVAPGSVLIFDSHGEAIAMDTAVLSADRTTVTTVAPVLGRGTYVVTWRALSGDSHPIQGAFTFNLGAPSTTAAGLEDRLLAERGSSRSVGVIYGALRAIVFVGLLVSIGGFAFLVLFDLSSSKAARIRRAARRAIAVMTLGSVLELLVVGPYFSGGGFGDVMRGSGLSETFETRLGIAIVLRLAIGIAGLALVGFGASFRRDARAATSTAWAVGAEATFTFAGHPRTGRWQNLAIVTDLVHIIAAGAWIGGLTSASGARGARRIQRSRPRWSRHQGKPYKPPIVADLGRFVGFYEELPASRHPRPGAGRNRPDAAAY